MSRKRISSIIVCTLMALSICDCGRESSNNEIEKETYKGNVIQDDNNTVSFFADEIKYDVSTEYQKEVEQLDNTQPDTGLEQQIQQSIVDKFSEYGINGVVTFSDKNFSSSESFEMIGHNETTTLIIVGYGNTETGEVYAEYGGSVNGSELMPIVGIDKLQCNSEDIEELLFLCGLNIANIGTIDDVAGTRVYISINGEQHIIDTLYNTVDDRTVEEWNGEEVEVTTTEAEEQ